MSGITLKERLTMCTLCGNTYEALDTQNPTHGSHCAAYVYKDGTTGLWMLRAAYGSEFDMEIFRFQKNYPDRAMDPVCDVCIQELVEDNDVCEITPSGQKDQDEDEDEDEDEQ